MRRDNPLYRSLEAELINLQSLKLQKMETNLKIKQCKENLRTIRTEIEKCKARNSIIS